MYDTCAHEIVEQAFKGINATMMAYGQTGAGKTFTMVGGTQSFEHRGVCPPVHFPPTPILVCQPECQPDLWPGV